MLPLEVCGLCKSYPAFQLKDVGFVVQPGAWMQTWPFWAFAYMDQPAQVHQAF